MNYTQVQLVQYSFEMVKPIAGPAAGIFYDRLFQLDPALRFYFKGDMQQQKSKLMTALAFVVAGLDRPETIMPAVQALGRRHTGYGVRPEHYQTVGEALLWTLEKGLGEEFTEEVEEAWIAAYTLLSTTMQEAARPERMAIAGD